MVLGGKVLWVVGVLVVFDFEGWFYMIKCVSSLCYYFGQIVLLGGKVDLGDVDVIVVVLCEVYEEIGLNFVQVEVLGILFVYCIVIDFLMMLVLVLIYGFFIFCFEVGEVEEVFIVFFFYVVDFVCYCVEKWLWWGGWWFYYVVFYGFYYIWGVMVCVLYLLVLWLML